MSDPFVHLHVASGYSLRYGASHPHTLVERAVEHEMDTLALTDRDGTYGAVKFARACYAAGIRPVLGVELAHHPTQPWGPPRPRPRTPVRGGALRDPAPSAPGGLPRVTFLASADGRGGGRAGWAALCRLVSATHLAGERGDPVLDLGALADGRLGGDLGAEVREHVAAGHLVVLLGPHSELARAATRRRDDLARAALEPWRALVPRTHLQVELVSHRLPGSPRDGWGPGTTAHAARMARVARDAGLGTVLSNAVRYADRRDAPTVDVLDAARRLVALDRRHVDRGNAEGFLKSGKQMAEIAEEVARQSGLAADPGREAQRLLAHTRAVADRCALDPRADLGLGEVHFPEFALSGAGTDADAMLRARCEGAIGDRYGSGPKAVVWKRLDDELQLIRGLGYASYFLTVGDVTDLIRDLGVRCAARGSGAGSLVNYLLGVSGVDPVRHGLLMERFLSPLREALPDIDVDVESARRLEVYERILDRYGGERCVCVSMMDTYRVRHAVRDVGAALGMPPAEVDVIAKAFPHIRARDARIALRELPELRASGLDDARLDLVFQLVERLDGLPRHVAVHPCGVLLSDATLLDRTPVEASFAGFPMSQFDKDDVEDLGLLKLDVLGIRMQSAMAHAVVEIRRTDGLEVDLDDQEQVPLDDPATYELISSAKTLGVFQIESPGQRELVGKSGLDCFEDVITDISLFRPGPVKSDMVTPYLEGKQQWRAPTHLHEDLRPILRGTYGVVVFHEQVIEIIAQLTGTTLAEADERRRALGDVEGMAETKVWFFPRALARGYPLSVVTRIWEVLKAFASFGFCKAHAAAFALPTFQSAWLKTHWPAHFLAGVLTHDPGMYPKRLILDDARQLGIVILGLDVNSSEKEYVVERVAPDVRAGAGAQRRDGIRLALAEVKGISEGEVERIVAARPYHSLTDFWQRARVSRPVVERLVLAGGFDAVYGIDLGAEGVSRRNRVTRRDLLLQVAGLDRHARAVERAGRSRGLGRARTPSASGSREGSVARAKADDAAARNSSDHRVRDSVPELERHPLGDAGVWARAAAQSRATPAPPPVDSVQLTLDLGDEPAEGEVSGLPELTPEERMKAELEILGLDASRHVVDSYAAFLDELGVVRSAGLLRERSGSELLVAGVKVATQTPPIRSGRRVVFLTLDDATGPVDATFFEDAQGPYAATVFHSWLLVVRGVLRRTGYRGVSLRATGCWELPVLAALWRREGIEAVRERLAVVPEGFGAVGVELAAAGAAQSRSSRPVVAKPPTSPSRGSGPGDPEAEAGTGQHTAGGMARRRVLMHSSGFALSPYADVKPAGEDTREVARKLWHRSPGSPG
ncbi:DNA polymerase III subunit alpha [Nocardioides anomalus]|uniref:DNA polymerase III subunit alpha n=1 Tax=Nocardioides anomalus TaxID=2712223 RepID=A0A6G6WBI8_9ACTN|nr:DNA polymerase III subunit alpha [Nocardioides anomalus]QIG42579.1 DNA polymerase III subunit alpha [Nocardioides anomalus]